jgi:hypothetical protein
MIDPSLRLLHVEGVTYNFIVDDGSISSSRVSRHRTTCTDNGSN